MYRIKFRSDVVRLTHNSHHIDWLAVFGFHETMHLVCMPGISAITENKEYPLVIIET